MAFGSECKGVTQGPLVRGLTSNGRGHSMLMFLIKPIKASLHSALTPKSVRPAPLRSAYGLPDFGDGPRYCEVVVGSLKYWEHDPHNVLEGTLVYDEGLACVCGYDGLGN